MVESKSMKINKILNKLFSKTLLSFVVSTSILLAPVSASALSISTSLYFGSAGSQASCDALTTLNPNETCGTNSSTSVRSLIGTIITILSIIIGIVSVVMIMVSGFRFITSGGDANKVAAAKSALIYALIGLAIAAMAQALVHFALNTATNAVTVTAKKKKS
jgi:hypothetical protein